MQSQVKTASGPGLLRLGTQQTGDMQLTFAKGLRLNPPGGAVEEETKDAHRQAYHHTNVEQHRKGNEDENCNEGCRVHAA